MFLNSAQNSKKNDTKQQVSTRKQVKKLIDDDCSSERLDDIRVQEFIINLAQGDSESESESDTKWRLMNLVLLIIGLLIIVWNSIN